MSDRLTIDAGQGLGVDPDALDAAAGRLAVLAGDLAGATVDVLGIATDPALVLGAAVAPASAATAAASVGALVLGRSTPAVVAAALGALAVQVEIAALRYRVGDDVANAVVQTARRAVAEVVVEFAPELAVGAGAAAVVLVGADVAARTDLATRRVLAGALAQVRGTGTVDLGALRQDALAEYGAVDDQVREDVAGVGRFLAAHPELVEQVVATTPAVLAAAQQRHPSLGVALGVLAPRAQQTGGVAGVAGTITALGRVGPLFRETAVTVRPATARRATPGRPPRGIAEVLDGVAHQSTGYRTANGSLGDRLAAADTPPPGALRLERVTQADGSVAWVVEIPGTQDWTPFPGSTPTPMDLTTNLRAVAGQSTATAAAVIGAMQQAGVRAGEPVLLAGHSQGGLTAAALAADPAVRQRFTITHVVTAGSPIDTIDVPDSVRVLSLEHTGDVVPALDGRAASGSGARTVVGRDVSDDPLFADAVAADPLVAHTSSAYIATAQLVDESRDRALLGFRESGRVFFDAPGATVAAFDFYAERVRRPTPAVASSVDLQRST